MWFISFISKRCPPRHSSCSDTVVRTTLNGFGYLCLSSLLTASKQCQWLSLLTLRFSQHCCVTSQKTGILGLTFFNIPSLSLSLCFRNPSPSLLFFTFSILLTCLYVYSYLFVYPLYFTLPFFVWGRQILEFRVATPLAVSNQNCWRHENYVLYFRRWLLNCGKKVLPACSVQSCQ